MDFARELRKPVANENDSDTNSNWCTWNGPRGLGKETGGIANKRKNRDYTDYSTVKIS